MLDHPVIDVALGLIFFYVVLSLVASAVQEWIASLFGLRSKNLSTGIKRLLGDDVALRVYEHPLIRNLAKENKLPSYIAPETLSAVVLEVLAKDHVVGEEKKSYTTLTADEVRSMVDSIPANHPLKEVLEILTTKAEDAADQLKAKLAGWFDEGMTRVSGWYKRQAKVIIFLIAAGVTIALNASTIHLAEELWRNDALRTQVSAQAQAAAATNDVTQLQETQLESLEVFPIGWNEAPGDGFDWLKTVLGWLITIAAVSLGAPFWFDLLGKVANLKGSGGKPTSPSTSGTQS